MHNLRSLSLYALDNGKGPLSPIVVLSYVADGTHDASRAADDLKGSKAILCSADDTTVARAVSKF